MTEAKPIGETAADLVERATLPATTATGSSVQSTTRWEDLDLSILDNLPARLTDSMMARVQEIARADLPRLSPCEADYLLGIVRSLSTMPRRADDDLSGELRLAHFKRDFGHYPRAAITFLHDTVRRECTFYPSPKECFEILDRWQRNDGAYKARELARQRVANERMARHADAMKSLEQRSLSQTEIDALPTNWKLQAVERGCLWRWPDGRFTVRKDTATMTEEEREANRAEISAMMAEWGQIASAA